MSAEAKLTTRRRDGLVQKLERAVVDPALSEAARVKLDRLLVGLRARKPARSGVRR